MVGKAGRPTTLQLRALMRGDHVAGGHGRRRLCPADPCDVSACPFAGTSGSAPEITRIRFLNSVRKYHAMAVSVLDDTPIEDEPVHPCQDATGQHPSYPAAMLHR